MSIYKEDLDLVKEAAYELNNASIRLIGKRFNVVITVDRVNDFLRIGQLIRRKIIREQYNGKPILAINQSSAVKWVYDGKEKVL